MGLEPTTTGTTIRCSAIELHPPQKNWSGCRDSNSGPLEPHSSALAWLRYTPKGMLCKNLHFFQSSFTQH